MPSLMIVIILCCRLIAPKAVPNVHCTGVALPCHLHPNEEVGYRFWLMLVQAWVLVNRQVYAVPLRVARSFYVNSGLPPEDPVAVALGRRVVRTLPYGQEPHNIYQVSCTPCV